MSKNPRYIGVGFPGYPTRNVSTTTTKQTIPTGKTILMVYPETQTIASTQPPREAMNTELQLDINEEAYDFVPEEYAENEENYDDDDDENAAAAVAYENYQSSNSESSKSDSDSDSETKKEPLGWSNALLEKREHIEPLPLPSTVEDIQYYLENRLIFGFDRKSIRIELSDTEIPGGVAFRNDIIKDECYISFYIENGVLEITHFKCPGGGKELLYDMISLLFYYNYFFGRVELEASPWINEPEKKQGKTRSEYTRSAKKVK
jgi:hypothetical protein